MNKSDVAVIISVIALVAVVVIIYFMYFRNQMQSTSYTQQNVSPSPILPSTTISQPTTTTPSMNTYYVTYVPGNQFIVPLPASPFVIVVKPTQQNQVFDAYVSMTPHVDDTAVQIVPTTVISETTVLVKSSDIQNYIGYPYLIVNSSAPFTIYVSSPPIITS